MEYKLKNSAKKEKINKNIFLKFLVINYSIVIWGILLFSIAFSFWEYSWTNISYLFEVNSIWILWIIDFFYLQFFIDVIIIKINYIILFFLYFITFRIKKEKLWYMISIIHLIISLFIWYFFQMIATT